MKRKTILAILVTYLLISGIYLLVPGEAAWAVPGQNPHRQSSPTRTSTPVATLAPGTETASPASTTVPQPPSRPLPLPAETVTPLFLTLFPPTATPRATWESVLWQTETAETRYELSESTLTPTETRPPAPSKTPDSTEATAEITPVVYLSLGDTLNTSICLDLVAIGIGLVLLVIGLILIERRVSPPTGNR